MVVVLYGIEMFLLAAMVLRDEHEEVGAFLLFIVVLLSINVILPVYLL